MARTQLGRHPCPGTGSAFMREQGHNAALLGTAPHSCSCEKRGDVQRWQPTLAGRRERGILHDVLARCRAGPRPRLASLVDCRQRPRFRPRRGNSYRQARAPRYGQLKARRHRMPLPVQHRARRTCYQLIASAFFFSLFDSSRGSSFSCRVSFSSSRLAPSFSCLR